jgi:pimeloyl-ACP methyl ester carboxylesterase
MFSIQACPCRKGLFMTRDSQSTSKMSTSNTLVLIPGFMTDSDLWRDVYPFWSEKHLIYADFSKGSSIKDLATHILENLPQKFMLLGFSMGGYVARQITYLAPERVEALILVGTSSRAGSPSPRNVSAQSFKGLSTQALATALHPAHAKDTILLDRLKAMSVRGGATLYERLSQMERASDFTQLHHIRCPTLVIAGANDQLRPLGDAEELAEALKAPLCIIEDCGHMIPLEKPEELGRLVADWLARLQHDPTYANAANPVPPLMKPI